MRIWLSRINRHHSDRLAGPLTPFRRRDKPGSRCPVIQFECIIAQDMTYCNGETSVIRPDLTSPGAYILFLGESLISQPSGEVHTPVWSQAFMGPVRHSAPLYEGSPMEDAALRNLRLENLRRAIAGLDVQGQNLLSPLRRGADHGGDRPDLRHLQNGGIKATEKAVPKVRGFCLMTGSSDFFGLQIRSKCPIR